jgi:hypothetical protein
MDDTNGIGFKNNKNNKLTNRLNSLASVLDESYNENNNLSLVNFESSPSLIKKLNNTTNIMASSLSSSSLNTTDSTILDGANSTNTTINNNNNNKKQVMSKSKKLGQILKLASVRGCKTKSLKHKFATQFSNTQLQQQNEQHTFISFEIDSDCHVCQTSLASKKALHCKSKFY